ncbi:hypothetical protein VTK73DRAFT_7786 [Phialemonium thermophilum]|uniref:Zn(2)-C6 fungal-type domain-containing protein n=1 Tax=Phialemonium thermophilum TaxID=223376 RepID=A0ABR3WCY4_9PEZI
MAEESNRPGGTRKKFATPPVKIACLSCRASRTRCDGTKPCANCQARGRECVYRPSRRGGARVRKKPRSPEEARQDGPAQPPPAEPDPTQRSTEAIPLENFIGPGAGLSQLPDWLQDSDFIFDSLFTSPEIPGLSNGDLSLGSGPSLFENPVPMVRAYADDRSL